MAFFRSSAWITFARSSGVHVVTVTFLSFQEGRVPAETSPRFNAFVRPYLAKPWSWVLSFCTRCLSDRDVAEPDRRDDSKHDKKRHNDNLREAERRLSLIRSDCFQRRHLLERLYNSDGWLCYPFKLPKFWPIDAVEATVLLLIAFFSFDLLFGSCSSHHHAATRVDVLTREPACLVAHDERDHVRNILRGS